MDNFRDFFETFDDSKDMTSWDWQCSLSVFDRLCISCRTLSLVVDLDFSTNTVVGDMHTKCVVQVVDLFME